VTPVPPRLAASVLLVRQGRDVPLEVYIWAAHADGHLKFHGLNDRLDAAGVRSPRRAPPPPA